MEFDPDNMLPDDCVALAELVNDEIMRRFDELYGASGSLFDIDRDEIVESISELTGLEFGDIILYREIGEYVMLDRQLRDMDDDERARWKIKRAAAMALVDSIVQNYNAEKTAVSEEPTEDTADLLELLEKMWKES